MTYSYTRFTFQQVLLMLAGLLLISALSSCRTAGVSVSVTYPPMIPLPQHVTKVAVYNRSMAFKNSSNKIESVITGESFQGDKIASEECIVTFKNVFNQNGVIMAFIPAVHQLQGVPGIAVPNALPWDSVKMLCRQNGCDALMVLENFDTNSDNMLGTAITTVNITRGYVGPKNINFNVKYYWRMYDTLTMQVLDQFGDILRQGVTVNNPLQPLPIAAVTQAGNIIANATANRYLLQKVWYERRYFRRANYQFKVARRKVIANDWNGAMDIWKKYAYGNSRKVAGRACFNMALGCEVLGNFDAAKDWAKKSYVEHGIRKGRWYLNELNRVR